MTTRTRWLTRAYLGAWAWLTATAADAQDAFIFGLPGTISTWLIVKEGGERAYGVEIPRRKS